MARNPTLLLRALSALLTYPDAELRAAIPEIVAAIRTARGIGRRTKADLIALAEGIAGRPPLEVEAAYVDLFDRGRATSLNLFEHVHGDGHKRGPAMIQLRQRYRAAGMEPQSDELPDHLPLVLEYLSCRDLAETRAMLRETAHILRRIGDALQGRQSPYAAVMAALLALAGEKGLDAAPTPPEPEDFDRTWEETPAFAPPEPGAPEPAATTTRRIRP